MIYVKLGVSELINIIHACEHDMYVEIMHFLKLEIKVNNVTTIILVIKLNILLYEIRAFCKV